MGMTVYADALFALNAAIDYLILAASAFLGGGEIRRKRLLAAACLGGVYAAASLFPPLGFLQSPILYAVSLALMLLLAFGWQKRTARLGVLFLALTFAFGGAVTVCARLFGTGLVLIGAQVYYPVGFFGVLAVAAVLYLVCRLVFTALAEHTPRQIEPMTLRLGAHTAKIRALIDTGNTLRDPITNERALVAHWQVLARLLPTQTLSAADFLRPAELMQRLSAAYPQMRFRLLAYRAVGTQAGLLLAVRCEREDQNGRKTQVLTAFSPTEISDGGNYEALTGGGI